MITCIIAVPDEDLSLTETIGGTRDIEHMATLFSRDEIISAAEQTCPDVCVLSPDLPGNRDVLDLAETLGQMGVRVIFLAGNLSPANPTIVSLVSYGVTDILYGRVTSGLLIERIRARGEPADLKTKVTVEGNIEAELTKRPILKVQDKAAEFARDIGQIIKKREGGIITNLIAVWSPYSSGRTFVAVNLCAVLAMDGLETILLDRQEGPAWVYVGAPEGEDGLESFFLKDDSIQATACPVDMLPGFFVLTNSPMIDTNQALDITRRIEKLTSTGLTVIANAGLGCGLIEKAAAVIVVANHDYNGLVRLQKALQKEEFWHDRIILCLNRDLDSPYLQDRDIEQLVGQKIDMRVPDYGVKAVESQRTGIPLAMTDLAATFTFRELAGVVKRQLEENEWAE